MGGKFNFELVDSAVLFQKFNLWSGFKSFPVMVKRVEEERWLGVLCMGWVSGKKRNEAVGTERNDMIGSCSEPSNVIGLVSSYYRRTCCHVEYNKPVWCICILSPVKVTTNCCQDLYKDIKTCLHDFRFDVQPTLQMSINIPLSFMTTEFIIGPLTRIQSYSLQSRSTYCCVTLLLIGYSSGLLSNSALDCR